MDFTIRKYRELLEALVEEEYGFVRFGEYIKSQEPKAKIQEKVKNQESSSPVEGSTKAGAKNQVRVQGAELSVQEDTTHHSSLVILRHDVDRLPENSLRTARIEQEMGIRGSYYFRIVPESWDEKIIKEIAALGHEIGYHYEDVDLAAKLLQGKSNRKTHIRLTEVGKDDPVNKFYQRVDDTLRMNENINFIYIHIK